MRLDLYLSKNFDIQSRNKALELILSNKVKVDGKIISKASFLVDDKNEINLKDKIALDIGSSTGGFTQILLEFDIQKVVCVDVGSNQLHEKIKKDKKIEFFENCDIRDFKSDISFDIVTCDVSFISILKIIDSINSLDFKNIIILFKPQFEVGTGVKRDKKGVVKDKNAILKAKENFLSKAFSLNWKLNYSSISKLVGKDGNEEEFFYFSKK